jgi:hypothetical protein
VRAIGAPELVIVGLLFGFLYATVYGSYRAFRDGDTGWGIGIIVAWVVGLGWLVGLVYLLAVSGPKRRRDRLYQLTHAE